MAEFGPDTSYGRNTAWYPAPGHYSSVSFFVAGMKASTTYHMRVVFNCFGELSNGPDQTFTTGALPANMSVPKMTVTRPTPNLTPSPGVELFNLVDLDGSNSFSGFVTDLQGNIIWYYNTSVNSAFPFKPMDNGHFIINMGWCVQEVDLSGSVIRQILIDQVNQSLQSNNSLFSIIGFHHDVVVLPNGHWIVLAQTTKQFTDLIGYAGVTNVLGDALLDVDLDGNVVWTWNAFDHLDVARHLQGLPDWTHSNAIVYTQDGNLLVSMRHQSWIIKIDYENGLGGGAVSWKLGEGGDFTLASGDPNDWFYAEHDPNLVTTDGSKTTLAIWDNGNLRIDASGATCGVGSGPACYSRATLFQIDEVEKTANLLWDYLPGFYSWWGGSIEQLSNGNVEFDMTSPISSPTSQIMEVTQAGAPQVVWQLNIAGDRAYRAYRVPSLYPGVTWQH
jgi:hypothetical protein